MKFIETPLPGVFIIEIEAASDARGFFARTWSANEARNRGLVAGFDEHSVSYNHRRGTLRGMHYQVAPAAETKVVRCTRGAIFDVVVDLRPESSSFRKWHSAELTAETRRAFYVPAGVAHGFLTLTDSAEVVYQITPAYAPELARGVRYDDSAFAIRWPFPPEVISERDRSFASFVP